MPRLALLSLLLLPGILHAQSTNTSLTVRFQNGSIVQQATLLDGVEMETKLGKLTIPASEIQRIDFGFRVSDEDAKKITEAMTDLKSDKHASREAATKTLLGLGKYAYPTLLDHRKGGDLEMTRRVEGLIKDIQAKLPVEALQTRRTDIVRTSDSTLSGHITSGSLKIQCEIFGDLKVPLWRLRDIRTSMGEMIVAVDAAKFGNRVKWMETDFEVSLDTRIEISATGEINLDPNNQLMAPQTRNIRPDGTNQLGSGEPYLAGVLLGKIGQDGPTFIVGSRHTLTPTRAGKLYFRIVTLEPGNNLRAEGSYQVRIASDLSPVLGGSANTPEVLPKGKGKKGFNP
jgi:hypothetical protein